MAVTIQMRNPQTGGVGSVDINRLQEALGDGMELMQDLDFFNPETQGVGKVPAAQASAALSDGLMPVGSRNHQVATTGKLESFGRGAVQSLTGGFADEIVGAAESLFTDKPYTVARDESRQNFRIAEEANPITSVAGSLAGGVSSMLVPGLGPVGAAGTLPGSVVTGVKLGAIYGLGNSEADLTKGDVGGAVRDVALGAGTGAAMGGLTHGAGKALGFVADKAKHVMHDAFDPYLQRALALGAKAADIREGTPMAAKLQKVMPVAEKMGLFANAKDKIPSQVDLQDRLRVFRHTTLNGMKEAVDTAGGVKLDLGDIVYGLREGTADVIERAVPGHQASLADKLDDVLTKVMDTDGDLTKLLELKRNSGSWALWDRAKTSDENRLYQAINHVLDDGVTTAVDRASQAIGPQGARLSQLNAQYEAVTTLQKLVNSARAQDAASSNVLGVKFTDVAGTGALAGLGGAIAGPAGAAAAGAAGTLGAAALRSTEGRLLRAQVGQALMQKAQKDAVATAQGAIPRTLQGVKQWVTQNMQFIAATMPQLAPMAQRLINEPPGVAEVTVRTMMPMLTSFMTPSAYPSEFEGKVFEPQDRLAISKQLDATPGLSTEEKAARRSQLAKDGTIPPEVYVPRPQPTLDDQIAQFTGRLEAAGY